MLSRIPRTILRVACVIGAIQLAGCAGYIAEQRLIWVQNRTDDVVASCRDRDRATAPTRPADFIARR